MSETAKPVALNAAVLSAAAFVEAVQLIIIAALILSFFPVHLADFAQRIFPVYRPEVRPERELMLYRLFVLSAFLLQAGFVFALRRRLDESTWRRALGAFTAVSGAWVGVQLFAVFKILLVGDTVWARAVLYGALAAALLSKIFWPELRRAAGWVAQNTAAFHTAGWRRAADAAILGILGICLFVPDMDRVLGRMLVHDKFYHLDSFLMAPGWAHLKGLALNQDVTSQYSSALPVWLGGLLELSGGFDYPGAVRLVMICAALYYALLYVFLRLWLKSVALSAAGMLLAVKLQLFHWGVAPLVWQYPSATPLRHFPDILFLFFVLMHLRTNARAWLWWACAAAGLTLAWMADVGCYMFASLVVYCLLWVHQEQWGVSGKMAGLLLRVTGSVLAVAAALLWLSQGRAFLSPDFWRNSFEFAQLFIQGWGALPVTEGLKDRQFFAFLMGLAIPCFYVWTLLAIGALLYLRRTRRENIIVALLCVYGLGLYHYFIHRSGVTSYYAVCIPLVLLVCFWLQKISLVLKPRLQHLLKLLLFLWTLTALATGYLFTYYPNVFNLSGFDWSAEERFYQQNWDFGKDAQLIRSLTGPGQRVPLISSFEVRILMQADRKPFFYYFPLMESAHMTSDEFRGTYLHTTGRFNRILAQLRQEKPPHIFIEQKLIGPLAEQFQSRSETLKALLAVVAADYTPAAAGQYLVAFKRK